MGTYRVIYRIVIAGIISFGFIDGLSSSIDFLTLKRSFILSAIVLLIVLVLNYLQKKDFKNKKLSYKGLPTEVKVSTIGVLLAFWIPLFLRSKDNSHLFTNRLHVESVQPSAENFNVLILPFGSSDYCQNEKILCERELNKFFNSISATESLHSVNVYVDKVMEEEKDKVYSIEDLLEKGKKYHADILIWGDYKRRCSWDSTRVIIHYAIFDDFIAKYSGMENRVRQSAGTIENISDLSRGELVGGTRDIVFWSLAVREALIKHNYQGAISLLRKVNAVQVEEFAGYYHFLAFCYQQIGDSQRAVEYYSVSVKLNEADFWPLNNRGAIYLNQMKIDSAKKDLLKAYELSNGRVPNVILNLSNITFIEGDIHNTIELLNEALKLDSTFTDALINRAKMYAFIGNPELGFRELEKIRKIKETTELHIEFALYYYSKGDYSEAMNSLGKANHLSEKGGETPYDKDPNLTLKINMLTWVILNKEEPKSKRCQELKLRLRRSLKNGKAIYPGFGEILEIDVN